eukprot:GHRR01033853.1.p1 GENE.GHRR01033853.1~~GHRR01033853.1.p1  ORF type:complete len:133 (+),score=35.03 GHRR01033853.1:474-872(+)
MYGLLMLVVWSLQDGQEFLKLLLTKLEGVFAASKQQEVASVVQRLFRGHFSYVTTCRNCHQPSEGSKRQVEYYELPLQVLNMHSLQQSMVSTTECLYPCLLYVSSVISQLNCRAVLTVNSCYWYTATSAAAI